MQILGVEGLFDSWDWGLLLTLQWSNGCYLYGPMVYHEQFLQPHDSPSPVIFEPARSNMEGFATHAALYPNPPV